jgi:cation:H+ antiporter
VPLVLAVALTLPGAALGAYAFLSDGVPALPEPLLALTFGTGILGAAMLLSWATEVVQLDVPAGLALALLALIAVLPEYAVDAVFAIEAGNAVAQYGEQCQPPGAGGESPCSLALANMTGANRLLVGIGWPLVVGVAVLARRRRKVDGGGPGIGLPRTGAIEVGFLGLASLFALTLPLRSRITLIDAAVLVAIFVAYLLRVARLPTEEPDLIGPSALVGSLPARRRRVAVAVLFAWAAAVVLLVAEHFADALVATGRTVGVSEFFLVQWVAPLASESPELVVASLYAWRLATTDSLGTLVASKVNQWTLLVGTLPVLFALSLGAADGLPIDSHQRLELLLTAAQALFAVTLIIDLRLDPRNAAGLFLLFCAQFVIEAVLPQDATSAGILGLSGVYLAASVAVLWHRRRRIPGLMRDAVLRNPDDLARSGS